ncbi:MAG: DUF2065 domain-containing protein [Pseudomonadota bacterium]
MLGDLLLVFALVLILEGLMPALNPRGWTRMIEQISQLPPSTIRIGGLVMIAAGFILFQLARQAN